MKPVIICIVGKSGSGKSLVADYLEKKYSIKLIQSYTTRKPRYEGEDGHIFVSELEYEAVNKNDMLAYTHFGDNHYWTLKKDVEQYPISTYVIDEVGLKYMKDTYKEDFDVVSLWIERNEELRDVSQERKDRDKGKFVEDRFYYDDVVINNGSKDLLFFTTDVTLLNLGYLTRIDIDQERFVE